MSHEAPGLINNGENRVQTEPRVVLVTLMGEGNHGTIGPVGDPEEVASASEELAQEVACPEYAKAPTNRWVCVDGRVTGAKMEQTDNETADPQTAGGLPITELSVEYMLNKAPDPVSIFLAEATKKTIANGQEAIVHGDTHVHKTGCGCNKEQQNILRANAANIDVVVPIGWVFAEQLELTSYLKVEDLNDIVATGGAAAENDALWDVTPEEKVDIIVKNGGKYEELIGKHTEETTRVGVDESAFDAAAFIRDHPKADGDAIRVFSATLGLLKKYYFDIAEKNGTSLHDAARQTMAAVFHNLGTAKYLSNKNMPAAVIA